MAAENDFLAAVAGFLAGPFESAPTPAVVGVAEPVADVELPAVVLSLEEVRRGRDGRIGGTRPGRNVTRLAGVLRVDVCAVDVADVVALSRAVVEALLSPPAFEQIERLVSLDLAQLGSVGAPEPAAAQARRREARFRFEADSAAELPETAGDVLKKIEVKEYVNREKLPRPEELLPPDEEFTVVKKPKPS